MSGRETHGVRGRAWWALLALLATAVAAGVGAAGCGSDDGTHCDRDKPCKDPDKPFCDLDAEYQSHPKVCIANPFGTCDDDSDCTDPVAPLCDDFFGCAPCTQYPAAEAYARCAARDTAAPACDPTGACVECAGSLDCPAAAPICKDNECASCVGAAEDACSVRNPVTPLCTDAGMCVECDSADDCTDPSRPICGASQLCVGCTAPDQCATGACERESGLCVAEGEILYVSTTGSDTVTCGDAMNPCQTIAYVLSNRLSTDRSWVKLGEGTFGGDAGTAVQVVNGETVHLVGTQIGAGTVIESDGSAAAIEVDNASRVSLEALTVQNGTVGISCGNTASVLDLWGVRILGNQQIGLSAVNCKVTMDSSYVRGNAAGGVDLSGGSFSLTNDMIVQNGALDPSATFGGVRLAGSIGTSTMSFNTIANNQKGDVGGDGAGVECSQAALLSLSSNIVWGNQKDGISADVQVDGNCNWSYSDINQGGLPGSTNVDVDPQFVDPLAGDFHLAPSSPVEGKGNPDADVTVDIDGDARPAGSGIDPGADEI